ncbi:MAG TPA: DUF3108 domain-containing protein [Kofleriaceae bacterium]|nr:DUF3108 domain-containing protein [Kofleriaceae bacterium]
MRPSWSIPLVLAASCGSVQGRTGGAPARGGAERTLSAMRFAPGEHLEWEVRWFGVLVGRVQLAAGQPGMFEGKRALVIRSLAQSDGALAVARRGQMELVTWVDLDRRRPIAQAGSFDEIYTGEVLGSRFGAAEWPRTTWDARLPGGQIAQSTHTAIGFLRGWRPEVGDRGHLFVRMRFRVLRIDLRAVRRERVTSALGRRSALRIEGAAVPVEGDALAPRRGQRDFPVSFWIDEEGAERVPVRIEIESGFGGTVRLDLVTYDRSSEVIATAPRAAER